MADNLADWPSEDDDTYPWERWADGQVWSISFGTDFDIPTRRMQQYLYRVADRRGERVKTQRQDGQTIVFQFMKGG